MTVPRASSRSEFATIRGLQYRLRHWGDPDAPCLLLLHGWADVSATFQFLADRLAGRWHLVAPDWRGCGGSQWCGQPYALGELACDLEQLISYCFGDEPARVIGHSMGANVATLFAAAQPRRVARLAMLDAYGTPHVTGRDLFDKLARAIRFAGDNLEWVYSSMDSMVGRLMQSNPRLLPEQARFLAGELCEQLPDGRVRMRVDPAWRDTFYQLLVPPSLYMEAWSRVEAQVMLVGGEDSYVIDRVRSSNPEEFPQRLAKLRNLRHVRLKDAGHNVHHDLPDEVSALLDDFFRMPQAR